MHPHGHYRVQLYIQLYSVARLVDHYYKEGSIGWSLGRPRTPGKTLEAAVGVMDVHIVMAASWGRITKTHHEAVDRLGRSSVVCMAPTEVQEWHKWPLCCGNVF